MIKRVLHPTHGVGLTLAGRQNGEWGTHAIAPSPPMPRSRPPLSFLTPALDSRRALGWERRARRLPRGAAVEPWQEGRNRKPNRTGRTEPNRTKPFNYGTGRSRTRKQTEPNRTEPVPSWAGQSMRQKKCGRSSLTAPKLLCSTFQCGRTHTYSLWFLTLWTMNPETNPLTTGFEFRRL